jgi:23S rRNA (cytosine1962-C5)-methyltransferase
MDLGAQARKTLVISRASAGFITRGHPWVRPDRFTRGLEHLRAGEPVILVDAEGRPLAAALADPAAEICARVYHRRADAAFDIKAAVARAWARRAGLHDDPATDCYRVIHGEADFLPGFRVERYAGMLVVVVLAACAMPHVEALCAALAAQMPGAVIVIKDHREDLRRADVATRVWQESRRPGADGVPAPDADTVVTGRELGVAYPLHPAGGLATGIYVDQRATRQWLRTVVPAGARVLNLFAYTGAFSLALLAHGAASAVDVDLSAPALAAATAAADFNDLKARHHVRHQDCSRFLREETGLFDAIICDPPTSAQGGEGWILRRDYPDLLKLAAARLAPGGLLLAACNTIGGKPFGLVEALREAVAESSGESVATPEPGIDIPLMNGFPEGRPFRLAAWRRA